MQLQKLLIRKDGFTQVREQLMEGTRNSGDVGYVNEKGETFIVDRIKELIKVKGLQVPPAELEDILHGHPDVADAAVIGVPDEKTGEKPKAFVVKGNPKLTSEEVIKYIEGKLFNVEKN